MTYSPEQIGNQTFSIVSDGFDRAEVAAFLREVADQVRGGNAIDRLERLADRWEAADTSRPTADHPSAGSDESEAPTRMPQPTNTAPESAPTIVRSPSVPAAVHVDPAPAAPKAPVPPPAAAVAAATSAAVTSPDTRSMDLTSSAADETTPVAEQLDLAKSLLDGVLDDVMGSLRPEH